MKLHRVIVCLLMFGSIWATVPAASAGEQSATVQVKVVISEEAARFWRANPVPDARPRETAIVNEQQADPLLAGSESRNFDPAPSILALAISLCFMMALGAKRRLRTATAVG